MTSPMDTRNEIRIANQAINEARAIFAEIKQTLHKPKYDELDQAAIQMLNEDIALLTKHIHTQVTAIHSWLGVFDE